MAQKCSNVRIFLSIRQLSTEWLKNVQNCFIYPLFLSSLRKIPGPPVANNFILGHYASFLNKGLSESFTYLVKRYGGIVRYHGLFNQPNLLISDPKLVREVLVKRAYEYPKFFISQVMVNEIAGESIFLRWILRYLDKQIGSKKEERITITELIPNITLDVIGLVGFNYEFNSTVSKSELAQAYKFLVNRNLSPLYVALIDLFPFIRKLPIASNNQYYDSIKIIKNISERLVTEQKNSSVRERFIVLLVKTNESWPIDEQLTHDELVSQVMSILLAGHETSSVTLTWALYFLAKNPDIQDLLRKEILDVFTDCNQFPTFDEISISGEIHFQNPKGETEMLPKAK
ncbi:cytochrome P450 [Gigaspora rosea]|uniref:Cytochrome P450 n=1 Tax=Gigaspora rosea TaxID=44941 RepID=A0A397V4R0_9GLOM|nr:cytochrome P450 [Gigaspora rosea]